MNLDNAIRSTERANVYHSKCSHCERLYTTEKCLINNILSTTNSKELCADIKDFYLNTTI